MNKVALLFTILFCFAFNGIAQVKSEPKPCEFNNLILEQANREAEKDSIIILIGRPGIKDTKKDLSKKRLYTARAYLVEYNKFRNPESVITAEAAFDGKLYYGGVEIYVNGKLLDVMTSYPNRLLGLGSCAHPDAEDDESRKRLALLYPWSYKKRKR